MLKIFLAIILTVSINLFGQISVSSHSVLFPQINVGSKDSSAIYIKNTNSQSLNIKLSNQYNVYELSDTSLTIPSGDSALIWIKYLPKQNVIDKDLIFVTSLDSSSGTVISLSGSGKYVDSYNSATFNLYDTQLKTVLTQLVGNHTSLGYNLARDKMFMEFDNQRVNGQGATQNTLECVYTGRLAVGYTDRTNAFNNYSFNTEHTWPQSTFNELEPMKSDLFHLFPTDVNANSIRSNYPFGKVVSGTTWQVGGSKLGRNSLNEIVFEPRDVHKGDVSRSMLYFQIRYPNNYGNFLSLTQENVFREWNKSDTVGSVESARNNAIAALQMKRNPFIDHPEFVDRIYSFVTNNPRPVIANLDVLPFIVKFDSTNIGDTSSQEIYFANNGNGQLIIDSIRISDPKFSLNINNSSIDPNSFSSGSLVFSPDSIKDYFTTLKIYSNAGLKSINLSGIGSVGIVSVDDESSVPIAFSLHQNYPNPFNPSTKIRYTVSTSPQSPPYQGGEAEQGWFVTLKVYDVLGNLVATLVEDYKTAGNYELDFNPVSSSQQLGSGVYFYQLRVGNLVETKKMMYLK